MPPKRKEHGRDDRAEKAAKLYLFCARDPDQSLKVPAAMMARGYTPEEAADRALQMQVRRLVAKIAGGDTARSSESAEPARTAPGAKAPPLTNATKRPPLAQLDPNFTRPPPPLEHRRRSFLGLSTSRLFVSKKQKKRRTKYRWTGPTTGSRRRCITSLTFG